LAGGIVRETLLNRSPMAGGVGSFDIFAGLGAIFAQDKAI
jgi:hypothetical protein